jgi:hypothetical protein
MFFMKLIARPIDLEVGGKYVIILNNDDADGLGIRASDRVCINYGGKQLTAIVDTTAKFTIKGEVIANDDVTRFFGRRVGSIWTLSRRTTLNLSNTSDRSCVARG